MRVQHWWWQIEQLQNTKLKLETVNDSMTAQLEEHKKKEEQLEEELEEVQRTAEQDKDALQSQLADVEVSTWYIYLCCLPLPLLLPPVSTS